MRTTKIIALFFILFSTICITNANAADDDALNSYYVNIFGNDEAESTIFAYLDPTSEESNRVWNIILETLPSLDPKKVRILVNGDDYLKKYSDFVFLAAIYFRKQNKDFGRMFLDDFFKDKEAWFANPEKWNLAWANKHGVTKKGDLYSAMMKGRFESNKGMSRLSAHARISKSNSQAILINYGRLLSPETLTSPQSIIDALNATKPSRQTPIG